MLNTKEVFCSQHSLKQTVHFTQVSTFHLESMLQLLYLQIRVGNHKILISLKKLHWIAVCSA